jgi:hypothetical protein
MTQPDQSFEKAASETRDVGLPAELSGSIFLSGTGVAPFIYALF